MYYLLIQMDHLSNHQIFVLCKDFVITPSKVIITKLDGEVVPYENYESITVKVNWR